MDIKLFTYILLASAVIFYLIPVENIEKTATNKDIALVVFEKPDMYTLTTEKTTRRVQAKSVVKYKNRDEMFDANIVLNENTYEVFQAKEVINKNNKLSLKGSVFYKKGDILSLSSEELFYKVKDKLVYNTLPFKATYYNSVFNGRNLYLDTQENFIKSRNVHFEVDLENIKGK